MWNGVAEEKEREREREREKWLNKRGHRSVQLGS
jgi:hypothetical protein